MTSTEERRPTVFLSMGAGADYKALVGLLIRADLRPTTWNELPLGTSWSAALKAAIDACDVVIAVIDSLSPPAAVLLEVGAAVGLGRPIVILVTDADYVSALPAVLRGLPVVVQATDLDAVAARISDTVAAVASTRQERQPERPADSLVDRNYQRKIESRAWADEAEGRVARALANFGARVEGQFPANSSGAVDLAAWLPSSPSLLLNPILVEVAGRRPRMAEKERQLRGYLVAQRVSVGMLVTAESDTPKWIISDGTAILILGVNVLEQLSLEEFLRLLADGRNRLVHGA